MNFFDGIDNIIPIPNGFYDNLISAGEGNMNGAVTENSFAGIEATTGVAIGVAVRGNLAGGIVDNAFNQALKL